MNVTEIVLEYLKVVISTPVIAGGVVVFLFYKFKPDIKALMGRIGKITFPGGSELSMSQLERTAEDSGKEGKKPPLPPTDKVALPDNLTLTPEQVTEVQQFIAAERANAFLWEYRFLNYHLVPRTQTILDWLAARTSPPSVALCDNLLQQYIPEVAERNAIMGTLLSHHLIDASSELNPCDTEGT